ncbi:MULTISPECIES: ATP-dependent DNA helicase [unclassified Methanobrevibacter]|jgi:DNA helicase-2/ATP-dependent DNA helicase PcrA|uniref:ATP-dependent DNA helicase n=1 Tax=unclassified Methanobrevibacter TaxID=2638681 RepID=UPI0039B8E345
MVNGLNSSQLDAVQYVVNNSLVIDAGPGTGKTLVIVERVKFLLRECLVDPESLLVITFTNKAANELKSRLRDDAFITDSMINHMQISTIHSFCHKLLVEYGYDLGLSNDLSLVGGAGSELLIMFMYKYWDDLGFNFESYMPKYMISNVLDKFNEYSTFGVDTEGLVDYIRRERPVGFDFSDLIRKVQYECGDDFKFPTSIVNADKGLKLSWYNARYLAIARAYPKYIQLLLGEGYFDHDLLQLQALNLLKKQSVRDKLVYKNILIDEFQDTDPVQMQIFELLRENCDSFTVVGDADQSIYSFRGANPNFFNLLITNELFNVKTLDTNYRSGDDIIKVNESFINDYRSGRDYKHFVAARRDINDNVFVLNNQSRNDEPFNIAMTVHTLISTGKVNRLSDIGILFRTYKHKGDKLFKEFDKLNINYSINSYNDFKDRDEIKSIMTLLWYVCGYHPLKDTNKMEIEWLNLKAFTNTSYKFKNYFNLSLETQVILKNIEEEYRKQLLEAEHQVYYKNKGKKSSIKTFKGIFNRNNNLLDEIEKECPQTYLNELNEEGLNRLGITNTKDLEFFKTLNNIRKEFQKPVKELKDKPSLLDLYYKLLNINNYLTSIVGNNNLEYNKEILKNLGNISQTIYNYEKILNKYDLKGLFSYLTDNLNKSLNSGQNKINQNEDAVQILTVHKSKGLEFPIVIVGSLQEDYFPQKYNPDKEKKDYYYGRANFYTPPQFLKYKNSNPNIEKKLFEDEEKRILYVAMTRAKDLLILSTLPNPKNDENSEKLTIIEKLKNKNPNIKELTQEGLNNLEIQNIKPSIDKTIKPIQLSYIKYLTYNKCPFKYYLSQNLSFRISPTPKIIQGIKLHEILNNIHSQLKENQTLNINQLIQEKNKHKINYQNRYVNELIQNIKEYYEKFAKNLNIKDSEVPFHIIKNNYELKGRIDLIIENPNHTLEIIDFKNTEIEKIDKNPEFYKKQLLIYKLGLKNHPKYEKYKINTGKIYSLKSQTFTNIPISDDDAKKMDESLNRTAHIIKNEIYIKNKDKCKDCKYKNKLCK